MGFSVGRGTGKFELLSGKTALFLCIVKAHNVTAMSESRSCEASKNPLAEVR